jgi:hypothetical protein
MKTIKSLVFYVFLVTVSHHALSQEAPYIGGFTPASGPPGTVVTLSGLGFTGSSTQLGSVKDGVFAVEGNSLITYTVPKDATTAQFAVCLGTNCSFAGSAFVVTAAPVETTYTLVLKTSIAVPGATETYQGTVYAFSSGSMTFYVGPFGTQALCASYLAANKGSVAALNGATFNGLPVNVTPTSYGCSATSTL